MPYRTIDSVSPRIQERKEKTPSFNNLSFPIFKTAKLSIKKPTLQKLTSFYLISMVLFQSLAGVFMWVPKGNEAKAAYMTLTPNATLSIAGPYDTAVAGAGNWNGGGTFREFVTIGQKYRIRQAGTISRIRMYTNSTALLTGFYLKIWRKNGTTYDLVGTSNNLASSLVTGSITTVDLTTPISGVQEGDYYGYRIEDGAGADDFYARTGVTGVTSYHVTNTNPSTTGYDWTSQAAAAGVVLPIELYMQSPQIAFIGDSIIAGHPGHYSFLETSTTTNIASTIENQFGNLTGYTYQNMGIGGQTTTQIAARFTNDIVNLHPRVAIMEGGVNDIAGGSITKDTFLNNWTAMLNACQANNITPVVIPIMPWTNGTAAQMATRDDWNASLIALASTYSGAKIVNVSSSVGQFRSGGPEGNLWDIKTTYNADGVHFNATGYQAIAQKLASVFQDYYLTISGNTAQTVGDAQTITLRAYDNAGSAFAGYNGDKTITLSGASAIGSNTPTFTDKNGADINFGSSGTIAFFNGVATTDIKLYKAGNITIDASDGTCSTAGNPDHELNISVSPLALDTFDVSAPSRITSAVPFALSLTAKDLYGNTITNVANNTQLSVSYGVIDITSIAAAQFQENGVYLSNIAISGIDRNIGVILTIQNGSISQVVNLSASSAYKSIPSYATQSIAGPYDTAVAGTGNWRVSAGINSREFITIGQQYRIRQAGTISRIRMYTASTDSLTGFYLKIWRKNGTTYDLVGTSNNLASSLVTGSITTVDLTTPISGVQEGDYYGYRMESSNGIIYNFYAKTSISGVTSYLVNNITPSNIGYDWVAKTTAAGVVLPIELYMQSPQIAFIGDSIIAGHPGHYSFLETSTTTNIASTIENQFGNLTGYTYQNMGIGGQTTTQIAARFTNDIVNLHPRVAIMEGGVNDIAGGSITKDTFLNNWTAMLNACQANNITPVVIPIMPWTNGTAAQMATRDDWNASLIALVQTYSNAVVVDMSSTVGQYSADGPEGNLWNIKTAYNQDGVHFNATGYQAIAQKLASVFQQSTDHLAISGSAIQNAGDTQTVTITAYNNFGEIYTDYSGEKNITLNGAHYAGESRPTFTDKNGNKINFGTYGLVSFTDGIAHANITLYEAETAYLVATDGYVNSIPSFSILVPSSISILPQKPQIDNIHITNTDNTLILTNLPPTITQIAISTTEDFKNISWEYIKDLDSILSQYTDIAKLYLKLRTNDGAVSDTITYNNPNNTDNTNPQDTDTTPLQDGDIVKTPNNPDIYVIKIINHKTYKRLILSPNIFNSYQHLNWNNVKTISQDTLNQYQTSTLVKEVTDTIIYSLTDNGDQGKRQPFSTTNTYDPDSIYTINKTERDSYEWEE